MHRLILISIVLISTGLGSMAYSFTNLYRDSFVANQSISTDAGAIIHKKTSENNYGGPIDGNYLVQVPDGKYVSVSNVKGWWLIGCAPVAIGLLVLVITFNAMRKSIAEMNHKSAKET